MPTPMNTFAVLTCHRINCARNGTVWKSASSLTLFLGTSDCGPMGEHAFAFPSLRKFKEEEEKSKGRRRGEG